MKTILKTIAVVLGLQLVLGTGYFVWVLSTPDSVLSTVTISRAWVAEIQKELLGHQERERQMLEERNRMGSTLDLLLGSGARRV